MKKFVVFLLGMISGIVLTFVAMTVLAIGANTSSYGMTFFDESGECLSIKSFEVMQVVDDNHALAHEVEWNEVLRRYVPTDLLVLLTNDNGEYYYDDQIIEVPQGMCMRQIGIYKYQTIKEDIYKTVPIVKLMSK